MVTACRIAERTFDARQQQGGDDNRCSAWKDFFVALSTYLTGVGEPADDEVSWSAAWTCAVETTERLAQSERSAKKPRATDAAEGMC